MTESGSSGVSDSQRQAIIDAFPVDSPERSAQLDRLAGLAAQICGAPTALISMVHSDRQHFIGRSGTSLTGSRREDSFCAHAMLEPACMVVPDARQDGRFRENPLVTGPPHIRFYAGQPLVSAEGVPLGSLCVIDDKPREGLSDEKRLALGALGDATMALLERWRLEQASDQYRTRSRTEIAALEQRFQVLADAMPQLVWSTTPDGEADYFNRVWCEFTGEPAQASYGRAWTDFLHEDDKARAARCWADAVASGQDYEIEYRLRHSDGDYRWVLARGLPLHDESGEVIRWIGTCTDIDQQKGDAERLDLLSRELNHRIKNIFAVIGGLIALTIRSKTHFSDAAAELRDRVLALGRAHDFARSRHAGIARDAPVQLSGLLQSLLAPYQDTDRRRITIGGDEIAIDDRSATPLALFFHELATNAAKYGALSGEAGQVSIQVRDADTVELVWKETGGPPVSFNGHRGFGSTLVEMSIMRQLGGTLDFDWREEGLSVTARIPATSFVR